MSLTEVSIFDKPTLQEISDGDAPRVAGRWPLPRLRVGAGSAERGTELNVSFGEEAWKGLGRLMRGIASIRSPRAHKQEQLQTLGSSRSMEIGEWIFFE